MGTWTCSFTPDTDRNLAASTGITGTAESTWTPTGTDPSGILASFSVSVRMDITNSEDQQNFLTLCEAEFTYQKLLAASEATGGSIQRLVAAAVTNLNSGAYH